MLFSEEIEDLHDDGFEGSINERNIFSEVFFGNNIGRTSNRCLVTGAINFESEYSKHTDRPFSNGENSVLTKDHSSRNSGLRCLEEGFTSLKSDDHDVKRIKSSVNKFPNLKSYSGEVKNSSVHIEGIDCRMSQPSKNCVCRTVTCRLVESSKLGITSSCYLLKRQMEMDRGDDTCDTDVSKCGISSLDRIDGKEIVVSKAIASPLSQESSATKLLVVSPSVTTADKSVSPQCANKRWTKSNLLEVDVGKMSLKRHLVKDPLSLLRNHINHLLVAAGWEIGRRRREHTMFGEYVYKSPIGQPMRQLRRAWNMCGHTLFADLNDVVQESESIQWTDITHFLSDLSNTLAEIEEELSSPGSTFPLVHRWCLLDPFAKIAFIDRTVKALKAGEAVRAKQIWLADTKNYALLALENGDRIGDQFGERHRTHGLCDSSLVRENYVSSVDTGNGTSIPYLETFGNKKRRVDLSIIPACGSDSTCDQSASSLYEVPITSGNENSMFGGFKSFCCDIDRDSVDFDEEKPLRIMKDVSMGSSDLEDGTFSSDFISTKKANKKAKKISEIKHTTLHRNNRLGLSTSYNTEPCDIDDNNDHLKSRELQEYMVSNARSDATCKQLVLYSSQHRGEKKQLKFKKVCRSEDLDPQIWRQGNKSKKPITQDENGKKVSSACQLKDDDLLISAILKNKTFKSTTSLSAPKKGSSKSKALSQRKSKKGSCRLLPRSFGKGGKNFIDGRWTPFGVKTVLSWLINSGVVSLNEVIQYRSPKDDVVVKDGMVTRDGILCNCCSKVLSLSEFKIHAGFKLNRPCLNVFMESGKPFTLCQLEAWSAEYKARKSAVQTVNDEDMDQNDDSCGLCGDGGELICCDNCPSTFHQACLCTQELPEGNWYCTNCTCRICGDVVHDKDASKSFPGAFTCSQCEHKYHEACLKEEGIARGVAFDPWFCGESCQEIHSGLHSRIGLINSLSGGFSWTLLRCIHGDQRVHSAPRIVALKADCNSKLAVALKIMEECFVSMVDSRTGIDMIPHVLYNWGSTFARLDYHGFYTMVLEKDDVLLSVAAIRIHGVTVAEMPLIATCSRYRRQGMCRRLMNCILEMLKFFKVEKLVITAIPDLVETWTVGFGFKPLEYHEKQSLNDINLMVFPGTVWLKKSLFENEATDQQTDDPAGTVACSEEEPITESVQQLDTDHGVETEAETQFTLAEFKNLQEGEDQDGNLDEHFSKLSREPNSIEKSHFEHMQEGEELYGSLDMQLSKLSCEPDSIGKSQIQVGCGVKSLDVNEEREFSSNNQLQNVHVL